MQKPYSRLFFLLSVVVMLALSGCATFSGDLNPIIDKLPSKQSFNQKPSVCLDVKFVSGSADGVTPIESRRGTDFLKPIVQKVSADSTFFSRVSLDPFESKDMDYTIKMVMRNHGDAGAAGLSGFISGLTFLIIPSAATDRYTLTATVTDRSGAALKKYEVNDQVTTWIGLVFIPFMGNSPETVIPKVWENMIKTVYQKMDQDRLMPYAQLPLERNMLALQ